LSSSLPSSLLPSFPLYFEVEDTGPGIDPEELSRLFEAFKQTSVGLNSGEGTGLGLPISQKFVQLMGGNITVKSELSKGSLFAFNILATLDQEDVAEPEQTVNQKVNGLAPNQPTYRILIAEDSSTNRLLLVRLLKPLGFEIKEAKNGQDALEVWEQWEPHLILMDMRMPVMNGYEATTRIKSSLKGQATVVIALTASAFEEQRQAILSTGCDDFLPKPFQRDDLLAKINHHLGVKYIYNKQTEAMAYGKSIPLSSQQELIPLTVRTSEGSATLHPSALQVMPAEWLEQLYRAASLCSDRLVFDLINQIPPENASLAVALTDLADSFQFDHIAALAKPQE
jgi:CheY-like chemotaxis protein